MVNSRNKGNRFEVEVCEVLSRWLYPSLPAKVKASQLAFRRRSTSIMPVEGHWEGHGDVMHRPDLPYPWPFAVECKKHEGWDLDGAFGRTWKPLTWWKQADAQALRAKLCPLLVFTRNRRPIYVMLPRWAARRLSLEDFEAVRMDVTTPDQLQLLSVCTLRDLTATDPARLKFVDADLRR